jgi:hypothetical protein
MILPLIGVGLNRAKVLLWPTLFIYVGSYCTCLHRFVVEDRLIAKIEDHGTRTFERVVYRVFVSLPYVLVRNGKTTQF